MLAAHVLANHRAALAGGDWPRVVGERLAARYRVAWHWPETPGETDRAARAAAAAGALLVIAGGDGSINRVVNALGETTARVGIVPLGTANDLARGNAVPLAAAAAAQRIADGAVRRLDVLAVNGRRFLTVGGLGLAADSALAVQRLRGQDGWLRARVQDAGVRAYWLSAAAHVLGAPVLSRRVTLRWRAPGDAGGDGQTPAEMTHTLSLDAHAVFVANQGTLGGGLCVSRGSRNDDGVFELCVLPAGSRAALAGTLAALVAGGPPSAFRVRVIAATSARIECATRVPFFGDGDLLCEAQTFDLAVYPRALELVG